MFYKTGKLAIPIGTASYFSIENWGDKEILDTQTREKKINPCALKYKLTIKTLSDTDWDNIYLGVYRNLEAWSRKRKAVVHDITGTLNDSAGDKSEGFILSSDDEF